MASRYGNPTDIAYVLMTRGPQTDAQLYENMGAKTPQAQAAVRSALFTLKQSAAIRDEFQDGVRTYHYVPLA